jgi:DNA-binding transcriptional regulator YiaG
MEDEKMTYREALLRARLTKKETAKFFNVSIQTVERWYRINKTPTGVIPALKLLSGDCPELSAKYQM